MHRLFTRRTGILVFRAAPNPLWGRWFGCPGAGPIRAGHRDGGPAKVLTKKCQCAKRVKRERGPESGHPDRLPAHHVKTNDLHHASRPQTRNITLAFAQQLMQYLG